ncbi:MAG: hypothetical protein KDA93_25590 [Planctomycetaceae bacterium]|nr:hypothetical protein [Planctomycetaceae bacterium]
MKHLLDGLATCCGDVFQQACDTLSFVRWDARDSLVLCASFFAEVLQPNFREIVAGVQRLMGKGDGFGPSQLDQLQSCGALVRAALPEFVDRAGAGWAAFNADSVPRAVRKNLLTNRWRDG